MTVDPIPAHKLKSKTWYYGIRCVCTRFHAICEDLFEGKTGETYMDGSAALSIACPCGHTTRADRLSKFKTP